MMGVKAADKKLVKLIKTWKKPMISKEMYQLILLMVEAHMKDNNLVLLELGDFVDQKYGMGKDIEPNKLVAMEVDLVARIKKALDVK